MAGLAEDDLQAYWQRAALRTLTPYTLSERGLIEEQLQRVREQGYAMVDGEYEVGMRVLAVPLHDRHGDLKATLSITTHASRVSIEELRQRYLMTLYEAQALLKPILD